MKKLLLFTLLLSGACELIIPRVLPDECTVGSPATCDGSVLSICEEGILITLDCGDLVCNVDTASCGACGDGVPSPSGEACDDGNSTDGDGCNALCVVEPTFTCTGSPSVCTSTCGNGTLDLGEECDDANNIATDACPTNCKNARCGDGFTLLGTEECDDANTTPNDGCNGGCELEFCGDGFLNNTQDLNGDGDTNDPGEIEQCDDGNETTAPPNNDDNTPNACRTDCQTAHCGDGVLDDGEACDDGNNSDDDGCDAVCVIEFCGDGITNNAIEECDDSNQISGDGCDDTCVDELCGDGLINDTTESCDDGNANADDGCSEICIIELCGDGITNFDQTLNALDQCDDGNNLDGDGCDANCITEFCGDRITNNVDEECDDGNTIAGDGCDNICVNEICGDGIVNNTNEECDDQNANTLDGCTNFCKLLPPITCNAASFPQGGRFRTFGASCFVGFLSSPRTWQAAQDDCVAQGGHLAVSDSAAEQAVMLDASGGGSDGNFSWIGYNDLSVEAGSTAALFAKVTGGIINAGFQNFQSGEPNAVDSGSNGADCVVISRFNAGKWFDESCASNFRYVCEFALPNVNPCGDGLIGPEFGEECDDGNTTPGDGCEENCTLPGCGDGAIDPNTEECDDGNNISGDGCDAICITELCGDGLINDTTEQCDDTNNNDFDGCNNFCKFQVPPLCNSTAFPGGNGFATSGFTCYASFPTNSDWQTSENACIAKGGHLAVIESAAENTLVRGITTLANKVWIGFNDIATEANTNANNFVKVTGGTIGSAGFKNFGAGLPDAANANQDCVEYQANADTWNDATCTTAQNSVCEIIPPQPNTCGNGVLERQFNEECDDGDLIDLDGCNTNCALTSCGDGVVNVGEQCDDGNFVNNDGCDKNCTITSCGNGVLNTGEQCEDNNTANNDGCSSTCQLEVCGDGITQTNEECDDNNAVDLDGCNVDCTDTCGPTNFPGSAAGTLDSNICYLLFTTALTWQNAENDCVAQGGHLSVIASTAENTIVQNLATVGANIWIGFNDIATEANTNANNFVKVTGGTIGNAGFKNFAAGQPDNNINEDCVDLAQSTGRWSDQSCTLTRGYVCELAP